METAKIEQIKTEQAIFTDLWNIYKKYANMPTDEEFEMYMEETNEIYLKEFKGKHHDKMFCEMLLAITNQIDRNWKQKYTT